jgi:hypothetical protein
MSKKSRKSKIKTKGLSRIILVCSGSGGSGGSGAFHSQSNRGGILPCQTTYIEPEMLRDMLTCGLVTEFGPGARCGSPGPSSNITELEVGEAGA